jgi:hypothetical protein
MTKPSKAHARAQRFSALACAIDTSGKLSVIRLKEFPHINVKNRR